MLARSISLLYTSFLAMKGVMDGQLPLSCQRCTPRGVRLRDSPAAAQCRVTPGQYCFFAADACGSGKMVTAQGRAPRRRAFPPGFLTRHQERPGQRKTKIRSCLRQLAGKHSIHGATLPDRRRGYLQRGWERASAATKAGGPLLDLGVPGVPGPVGLFPPASPRLMRGL